MKKKKTVKDIFIIPKGCNIILIDVSIKITCSKGSLWITWPWSGDILLKQGDSLYINSGGKICVNAFEDSSLHVETTPSRFFSRVFMRKYSPFFMQRFFMQKS